MSEWKVCKLGDVVQLNYGKGLPERMRKPGTIPVFSSAGLTGWHDVPLVNSEGIIVGRKGTIGTVYYINEPFFCIDTAYYIEPDKSKYDIKYLYYLLISMGLSELNEDSAVPGLNRDTAYAQDITLPQLSEQRAIAGVLSSLDDKIDLLHRQNKTLEGMAEALWRKMFIEDADQNWMQGKLGDIADNIKNGVNVRNLQNYEHYVGLEHIERKHLALYNWGETQDIESNKFKFDRNDILFGKLRAYFHKVCFAPVEGICSTDILVIRPKKTEYFSFCLMWFFSEDVVNYSDASSSGTRMPRTNWETLAGYEIDIPNDFLLIEFARKVKPLIDKIEQNIFSIRTLSLLRDNLLQKLMSGKIILHH